MSRERSSFGNVKACPECNESGIESRIRKEPKYYCPNCEETFNEPLVREALGPTTAIPNNDVGQALWRISPDEFSEKYVPDRYRRDTD